MLVLTTLTLAAHAQVGTANLLKDYHLADPDFIAINATIAANNDGDDV